MAAPVTVLHPPSNFSMKQILSSIARPDVPEIGLLTNNLQMVQLHSPYETYASNRSLAPPLSVCVSSQCRHRALSCAPHGMVVLSTSMPLRPLVPAAWPPMAVLPNWQIGNLGKVSRDEEATAPLFSAPTSVPSVKNAVAINASFYCSYNFDSTPFSTLQSFPSACHWLGTRTRELNLNGKKRRTVFTREQIDQLEATFDSKRYLSSTDRVKLSMLLKMSQTQIKVWFQNRRNKWRKNRALAIGNRRRESYNDEQAESPLVKNDDKVDFSIDGDLPEEEDQRDRNFSVRHKPSKT